MGAGCRGQGRDLTRVGFLQSGRIRKSKIAERIEGIGK
jgi:hypothetical protein